MADLTASTPKVAISIATTDGARAFGTVLEKRESELAAQTLDSLIDELSASEQATARAQRDAVTTGLRMSPSDVAANERAIRTRLASLTPTNGQPATSPQTVDE